MEEDEGVGEGGCGILEGNGCLPLPFFSPSSLFSLNQSWPLSRIWCEHRQGGHRDGSVLAPTRSYHRRFISGPPAPTAGHEVS